MGAWLHLIRFNLELNLRFNTRTTPGRGLYNHLYNQNSTLPEQVSPFAQQGRLPVVRRCISTVQDRPPLIFLYHLKTQR